MKDIAILEQRSIPTSKLAELHPKQKNKGSATTHNSKIHDLKNSSPASIMHRTLLDLSFRALREIPAEFYSFSRLVVLRLDNNQINGIPSGVSKLQCLEVLSVARNCVYYIDPSIKSLRRLKALYLNGNLLEEWPRLPASLEVLRLEDNPKIKGIALDFCECARLKEFTFDWLQYLPEDAREVRQIHDLCRLLAHNGRRLCSFREFICYFVLSVPLWQFQVYPLHIAAKNRHNKIIMKGLINLVDLNIKDDNNLTALVVCMKEKNEEGAKLLLSDKNLDVNCLVDYEDTLFSVALKYAWVDVALSIVEHPLFQYEFTDFLQNTPLHILFTHSIVDLDESTRLFNKIVELPGFKANIRNGDNLTPLHCAVKRNQEHFIRLCIQYNRTHSDRPGFDFNAIGGDCAFSVMHYLAVHGSSEIISEVCVQHTLLHIDFFARDEQGRTPRQLLKHCSLSKLLMKYENRQKWKQVTSTNTETGLEYETIRSGYLNTFCEKLKGEVKSRASKSKQDKFGIGKCVTAANARGCGWEESVKETVATKDTRVVDNRWMKLSERVTKSQCKKLVKYQLLYSMLRKRGEEAELFMQVLIKNLRESNPFTEDIRYYLSLIHICRCRRYAVCRSRWSPYH
eukprot:TRINITY_DN12883_c0_g1_i1.p1 TRINITY_DN12883_c0_g1~~TRINITY_DN12883_c0_g1_i1.p1  ORF type:complete len:625 (-),score=90.82 TRINITY_DN12883_c0_g1_i1:15-1889(-)